jgi:hypothetical protein
MVIHSMIAIQFGVGSHYGNDSQNLTHIALTEASTRSEILELQPLTFAGEFDTSLFDKTIKYSFRTGWIYRNTQMRTLLY